MSRAEWRGAHTPDMHLHRSSALGYASAASAAHSWYTAGCAVRAPLKRRLNEGKRLGLSVAVGGCIRAWRYFGPYPVKHTSFANERPTYNVLLVSGTRLWFI